MDITKDYRIPFTGLKDGVHEYDFDLSEQFFAEFGNEEIEKASATVSLSLNKLPSHMELTFTIEGELHTECDRCAGDLTIEVDTEREMMVKLEGEMEDDDVILLASNAIAIEMAEHFYETFALAIPLKRLHEEGACDADALKRLDQYSPSDEDDDDEIDPRWAALKNLKD